MKKITIKLLALSLIMPFMLSSCASILNSKNQKVTIHTSSADSKVYIDDVLAGSGKTVITKMKRDMQTKQIRVERDGYKPVYKIHYQDRKSALHIMSWIPFGLLIYPPFCDNGSKAYNYAKEISTGNDMLEIQKKTDADKYVYLKNTAFDVKKEDIKYTTIKHRQLKKNKNKYKDRGTGDEDLKFDNTIFTESVNEILKKYSYVDTTNTIFKSNTNTLYISAKITKVEFDNVYRIYGNRYFNFLITKLDIEWEMFDMYNQSKYKQSFKASSGEFAVRGKEFTKNSIEDAVTESFFKFMDTKDVKKLLKQQETKEIKMETLKLLRPALVSNLEDAMEATVTIKTKEGHGSGSFITNDGYVLTNFHVISGAGDKAITVVCKDGKEYSAKVIRKNEYSDLALLKVEGTFAKAFTLPSAKNYKVGEDIFAIGTPKSIELGQSLSKGIISGFRSHEKNNWIQTDASVNGGNSGGALVNKNGEFIGVVNAKVFGLGVEGLGFSIPAETVFTDLSIAY